MNHGCPRGFFSSFYLMFFVFIQVLRDFKRPDGMTEKEIDAAGDGENLYYLMLVHFAAVMKTPVFVLIYQL